MAPVPPSPPTVNALSAPTTPGKRLPVIDRSKVDPELVKAAEGMESMFLDYLMETMRKTVDQNPLDLDNDASRMYRNMLDSESAKTAAHSGGIGIADLIIAYMATPRYTVTRGNDSLPEPSTGGTDEGR